MGPASAHSEVPTESEGRASRCGERHTWRHCSWGRGRGTPGVLWQSDVLPRSCSGRPRSSAMASLCPAGACDMSVPWGERSCRWATQQRPKPGQGGAVKVALRVEEERGHHGQGGMCRSLKYREKMLAGEATAWATVTLYKAGGDGRSQCQRCCLSGHEGQARVRAGPRGYIVHYTWELRSDLG